MQLATQGLFAALPILHNQSRGSTLLSRANHSVCVSAFKLRFFLLLHHGASFFPFCDGFAGAVLVLYLFDVP